jgi:hypothetical protein
MGVGEGLGKGPILKKHINRNAIKNKNWEYPPEFTR